MDEIADRLGPDAATASLCINYGGRDEIKNAVRAIAQQVKKNGEIQPEDIHGGNHRRRTLLHGAYAPPPHPDLINPSLGRGPHVELSWGVCGKSGEYSEYYFTDLCCGRDFKTSDLDAAIGTISTAEYRRVGGVITRGKPFLRHSIYPIRVIDMKCKSVISAWFGFIFVLARAVMYLPPIVLEAVVAALCVIATCEVLGSTEAPCTIRTSRCCSRCSVSLRPSQSVKFYRAAA